VREVTDRDPQLLIVQLDTGFKVLLYNHEVELLPATDEVSAPSYYQPVLPAPDVEPESPALTPDEIMDITRSFCR
jgi:hypothetical protein